MKIKEIQHCKDKALLMQKVEQLNERMMQMEKREVKLRNNQKHLTNFIGEMGTDKSTNSEKRRSSKSLVKMIKKAIEQSFCIDAESRINDTSNTENYEFRKTLPCRKNSKRQGDRSIIDVLGKEIEQTSIMKNSSFQNDVTELTSLAQHIEKDDLVKCNHCLKKEEQTSIIENSNRDSLYRNTL